MKIAKTFTPEQEEQVEEAIRRAEGRTSGEIVPMVVPESDDYPHLQFLGGILGLLLGTIAGIWTPEAGSTSIFVACQGAGFVLGFVVLRHSAFLRRAFLSSRIIEDEVYERALRAFRELSMDRTQDRTGILIMVSLMERRVQVLADSGINAIVRPGTWEGVVANVLEGVRQGDLSSGLCSAIEQCGNILSEPFPPRADDEDELPNRLHHG